MSDVKFIIEFDTEGRPVIRQIAREVDEAESAFTRAAAPLDNFISKAQGLLGVFGIAAGAAGIVGFARSVIATAGELQDLSAQTGIAASTLAGLKSIAEQSGVSIQEFAGGIRFMLRSLADSTDAAGGQIQAFEDLGFSVADVLKFTSDPEGFLDAFAKKMAAIENPAKRLSIAMDLASRAGGRLAPVLIEIAEQGGLDKIRKDSEALGPAIQIIDAFGDAITRLKNKIVQGAISKIGGLLFDTGAIKLDRVSQIKLEIAREEEDIRKLEQSRSTVFGRLADEGAAIFGGGIQSRIDKLRQSIEINKNILELIDAQGQKPSGAGDFVNSAKAKEAETLIKRMVGSLDLQRAALGRTGDAAIALAGAERMLAVDTSDLAKQFPLLAEQAKAAEKSLTAAQIAMNRITRGEQATTQFEQQFGVEFDFTREKKGFDLAANFVAVFERNKNNPANTERLNQAFSSFVQQALALGLPDIPNLLFRQGLSRDSFLQLRQNLQQTDGGEEIVTGLDRSRTAADQWGAVWDEKVAKFTEGAATIGEKLDTITSQFETLRKAVAERVAMNVDTDSVIAAAKEVKNLDDLIRSIPPTITLQIDVQSNVRQAIDEINNAFLFSTGQSFFPQVDN